MVVPKTTGQPSLLASAAGPFLERRVVASDSVKAYSGRIARSTSQVGIAAIRDSTLSCAPTGISSVFGWGAQRGGNNHQQAGSNTTASQYSGVPRAPPAAMSQIR